MFCDAMKHVDEIYDIPYECSIVGTQFASPRPIIDFAKLEVTFTGGFKTTSIMKTGLQQSTRILIMQGNSNQVNSLKLTCHLFNTCVYSNKQTNLMMIRCNKSNVNLNVFH